jgi:hypothetical protein
MASEETEMKTGQMRRNKDEQQDNNWKRARRAKA